MKLDDSGQSLSKIYGFFHIVTQNELISSHEKNKTKATLKHMCITLHISMRDE